MEFVGKKGFSRREGNERGGWGEMIKFIIFIYKIDKE